jgi:hypothetical protein
MAKFGRRYESERHVTNGDPVHEVRVPFKDEETWTMSQIDELVGEMEAYVWLEPRVRTLAQLGRHFGLSKERLAALAKGEAEFAHASATAKGKITWLGTIFEARWVDGVIAGKGSASAAMFALEQFGWIHTKSDVQLPAATDGTVVMRLYNPVKDDGRVPVKPQANRSPKPAF